MVRKRLKIIPVMGNNFQQKISLAHQHMAFAYIFPLTYQLFKLLQIGFPALAGQPNKGKIVTA